MCYWIPDIVKSVLYMLTYPIFTTMWTDEVLAPSSMKRSESLSILAVPKFDFMFESPGEFLKIVMHEIPI